VPVPAIIFGTLDHLHVLMKIPWFDYREIRKSYQFLKAAQVVYLLHALCSIVRWLSI